MKQHMIQVATGLPLKSQTPHVRADDGCRECHEADTGGDVVQDVNPEGEG
jgi:hypothetical protein